MLVFSRARPSPRHFSPPHSANYWPRGRAKNPHAPQYLSTHQRPPIDACGAPFERATSLAGSSGTLRMVTFPRVVRQSLLGSRRHGNLMQDALPGRTLKAAPIQAGALTGILVVMVAGDEIGSRENGSGNSRNRRPDVTICLLAPAQGANRGSAAQPGKTTAWDANPPRLSHSYIR